MLITKRNFLKSATAAIASLPVIGVAQSNSLLDPTVLIEVKPRLKDLTRDSLPISAVERQTRIAKAQSLMQTLNVEAVILEPGPAMEYFTGIQWWRSERLTCVVIPKEGEIAVVCPFFEEPSILERMDSLQEVRVWQEHESPFERVKQILADRKIKSGKLAFESSVRYFVQQGIMTLLPDMQDVSAASITRGCRMYKSKHELQLMHKANEITLTAYAHVFSQLRLGMSQSDVKRLMESAQHRLGGSGIWGLVLINEASAYPHGTMQKQTIREGSIILMDCGCSVHGYQSDISRTFVFGEPTKIQQEVWNIVREGQRIVFNTAKLGLPTGKVDDAVRAYYTKQGFGPDYKLPGLSHRTGHGIGMEGHEPVNFVRGEAETLKPGMCFSNEPGIYIPGKFGVRLEDCVYMTEKGIRWFTQPPDSLSSPIGELAPLSV